MNKIGEGEWEGLECPVCKQDTLTYTNYELYSTREIKGEGVQCSGPDCRFLAEHEVVGTLITFLDLEEPDDFDEGD